MIEEGRAEEGGVEEESGGGGRAEGERAFLGLTHNPFVEPHRGFFERGGRKTHLEQLRHLSEWSRRILLVTGPDDVGKTTLYRELAATLEPRVKAARINASLVNTGYEVLAAIAQGFGLGVPTDANTQSLRLDIIEHVESQSDGDRLCLTLVDDAHLLDNKAVESLIALTHESAMHLVLFGQVRMVPTIERAASAKGVGWQEIRLTGYGEADARDYLEWRFQQAKYRGRVPFTDNEVKDLVKLSEGLPGRINQMANVLLVKLESGEGEADRKGFPRLHAAVLALLVVLVGLLYVIFAEESIETDADPLLSASVELTEIEPVVDATAASVSLGEAEETVTEDIGSLGEEAALTTDLQTDTQEAFAASEPATGVDETSLSGTVEPVENTMTVETSVGASVIETSVADSEQVAETAAPAVKSTAEPEPEPEPEPVAVESAPAEQSPPVQAPAGAKDTNWLLKQDADYYTLQLVTVSAADRAAAFVARQLEPGEFTIYQLQREGRILHVVLYGLFSSRDAAQTAADNLPSGVGDVQPWIRQVGQVQAAARLATFQ